MIDTCQPQGGRCRLQFGHKGPHFDCLDDLGPLLAWAKAEGAAEERKACAHALVQVARDYRSKYGKAAENIVCLPLRDAIIAIRARGGRP